MAWRQIINNAQAIPASTPYGFSRFFSKSTPFVGNNFLALSNPLVLVYYSAWVTCCITLVVE
ncbi:hypothetical protein SLEP1_g13971 [Rubroshorea leprosula]|uniref:Uncharacterized protein n=1 Tax=Rubroshorea leprosula TaxID=152421 RepID=A0AAV5IHI6_9ROSI|nr:hypothetical protein SLEP1_g13971 [Rubroshorea leprosula]